MRSAESSESASRSGFCTSAWRATRDAKRSTQAKVPAGDIGERHPLYSATTRQGTHDRDLPVRPDAVVEGFSLRGPGRPDPRRPHPRLVRRAATARAAPPSARHRSPPDLHHRRSADCRSTARLKETSGGGRKKATAAKKKRRRAEDHTRPPSSAVARLSTRSASATATCPPTTTALGADSPLRRRRFAVDA